MFSVFVVTVPKENFKALLNCTLEKSVLMVLIYQIFTMIIFTHSPTKL